MRRDSPRRFSVPLFWNKTFLPAPAHQIFKGLADGRMIMPNQSIGALRDGLGSLGIFPEREAGNPEIGGFL